MLTSGQRVGGFAVQHLLGRGAMGEVYRAEQTSLRRPVAIKRIAEHLLDHDDALKRFQREAQTLARVNSPHVVGVYEFGQFADASGEQHWLLVMELVEGAINLRKAIDGPMDWREATSIVWQAAQGLASAQEQQVIHRDIKPDNIMLTAHGVAKLTDFGLAKAMDTTGLTIGQVGMGTPLFMAPEVWDGEFGPAGDIYALGITWYQMLTGDAPFTGQTLSALMRAHQTQPPPRTLQEIMAVPEPLVGLCYRCLAKRPQDRPASAADLVAELDAIGAAGHVFPRTVKELATRVRAKLPPAGPAQATETVAPGGPTVQARASTPGAAQAATVPTVPAALAATVPTVPAPITIQAAVAPRAAPLAAPPTVPPTAAPVLPARRGPTLAIIAGCVVLAVAAVAIVMLLRSPSVAASPPQSANAPGFFAPPASSAPTSALPPSSGVVQPSGPPVPPTTLVTSPTPVAQAPASDAPPVAPPTVHAPEAPPAASRPDPAAICAQAERQAADRDWDGALRTLSTLPEADAQRTAAAGRITAAALAAYDAAFGAALELVKARKLSQAVATLEAALPSARACGRETHARSYIDKLRANLPKEAP